MLRACHCLGLGFGNEGLGFVFGNGGSRFSVKIKDVGMGLDFPLEDWTEVSDSSFIKIKSVD